MYQIWRIYLDLWGHDCKKWVWPTFGCKLGQNDPIVMQLKLDMSCHLLNVYTKFQIDISKHVEEKSGKRGRTDGRTDRRTDGRTLPRHNTSRFSNGRIKIQPVYLRPFVRESVWGCSNESSQVKERSGEWHFRYILSNHNFQMICCSWK